MQLSFSTQYQPVLFVAVSNGLHSNEEEKEKPGSVDEESHVNIEPNDAPSAQHDGTHGLGGPGGGQRPRDP